MPSVAHSQANVAHCIFMDYSLFFHLRRSETLGRFSATVSGGVKGEQLFWLPVHVLYIEKPLQMGVYLGKERNCSSGAISFVFKIDSHLQGGQTFGRARSLARVPSLLKI